MMPLLLLFILSCTLSKEAIDIQIGRGNDTQNYSVISNSSLNSAFNISTMSSSCSCSYNDLFYELPEANTVNFTIIPSDYSKALNSILLLSNNKIHPSYYSLKTNSDNKTYSLAIETQCSINQSHNPILLTNQSSYYRPDNVVSYENWSAIRFQFSYDNTEYYFEYIKFCQLDSKLLSITSCVIIFLIATFMLFLSTYMQIDLKIVKEVSEITEIKWYHGFIFVIIISCVLLLIFFFIKYMVIIYTLLFFFQSLMCLYYALKYFSKSILKRLNSELNRKRFYSFKISDYISILIALGLVVAYFVTRHWVLNNVLAFGMVFTALSLVLFKNFKVCFWFLLCIFLYDTFWVFFSERLFHGNNVMVKAATSIRLPIKLEMPILFSTNPIKDCMLLGLGDIALPGLIVKYCKRFDSLNKMKHNYFWIGILFYVISVAFAMMMMFAFEHSQPVLFYISPMFIIGLLSKAHYHSELKVFWNGIEKVRAATGEAPQEDTDTNNDDQGREGTEMEFKKVKLDD